MKPSEYWYLRREYGADYAFEELVYQRLRAYWAIFDRPVAEICQLRVVRLV